MTEMPELVSMVFKRVDHYTNKTLYVKATANDGSRRAYEAYVYLTRPKELHSLYPPIWAAIYIDVIREKMYHEDLTTS